MTHSSGSVFDGPQVIAQIEAVVVLGQGQLKSVLDFLELGQY
jgi:hypothetical protein